MHLPHQAATLYKERIQPIQPRPGIDWKKRAEEVEYKIETERRLGTRQLVPAECSPACSLSPQIESHRFVDNRSSLPRTNKPSNATPHRPQISNPPLLRTGDQKRPLARRRPIELSATIRPASLSLVTNMYIKFKKKEELTRIVCRRTQHPA